MAILIIFFLGFAIGGIIEYFFAFFLEFVERKPFRINHRFTIGKKVSLLSLPIWGILALLFFHNGISYILLFFASAVVGTVLEALLWKFIRNTFGVMDI